jgi:protein associated with RNAse G/E
MKPIQMLKTDITKQQQQTFILCNNPTIHVKMTDRKLTIHAVNMKMFDSKNLWKVNATIHCKKVNGLGFESHQY